MAADQTGQRNLMQAPWLKLFGAFKVALDPKKLLLAGAGIVATFLGWWLLAVIFYRSTPPQWEDPGKDAKEEEINASWQDLKQRRESWNLKHELAGPAPADLTKAVRQDAVDLAQDAKEYFQLVNLVQGMKRYTAKVQVKISDDTNILEIDGGKYSFKVAEKTAEKATLEKLKDLTDEAGRIVLVNAKERKISLRGSELVIEKAKWDELNSFLDSRQDPARMHDKKALALFQGQTPIKPFGRLRGCPWSEYRGPNPFLVVTGDAKVATSEGPKPISLKSTSFFTWLIGDQVPVLLEPLCKFMDPIVYFFKSGAGGWNRIYLFLVILWMLAVWGFFGGAITRMAAVQVARQNEKISMTEALRFARSRFQSFFSAPLIPLVFLAFITVLMFLFGLLEGISYMVGDFIGPILLPLVLIGGLVMAVVLVGLLGWPLMYPTISTEGSDSFDALSRSYSYVYQAPWHYIWYSVVAVAYGAVLIFFVGFMGSLLVYLGKWGISNAPLPQSRQPVYLYHYAPTSFGWRDLMLHKDPHVETHPMVLPNGLIAERYEFTEKYKEDITWHNNFAAFLVMIWLALVFLMVVGFGYSYFWTAATTIYLLLRRKVDDTELDEIHLEEEEETMPPLETAGAGGEKPSGGVTLVEAPTLRNPTPPAPEAPPSQSPSANAPEPPGDPSPPTDGPSPQGN